MRVNCPVCDKYEDALITVDILIENPKYRIDVEHVRQMLLTGKDDHRALIHIPFDEPMSVRPQG